MKINISTREMYSLAEGCRYNQLLDKYSSPRNIRKSKRYQRTNDMGEENWIPCHHKNPRCFKLKILWCSVVAYKWNCRVIQSVKHFMLLCLQFLDKSNNWKIHICTIRNVLLRNTFCTLVCISTSVHFLKRKMVGHVHNMSWDYYEFLLMSGKLYCITENLKRQYLKKVLSVYRFLLELIKHYNIIYHIIF